MRKGALYGKAHSECGLSRKDALWVTVGAQNALFRYVAAPGRCGATPRQAAGHYGECLNWANALEQPPASLRGGLCQGPQISVRSLASRKDAFWLLPHGKTHSGGVTLTEKRIPQPAGWAKCVFP